MAGSIRGCGMNSVASTAVATPRVAERGLWSDAWRRLRRNRAAMVALIWILLVAVLAVVGPYFSPHPFDELDWDHMGVPPQMEAAHWLGTDRLGRDLFVRTMYGVRISLQIGLLATFVSLLIGVVWGATAGYVGGRIDHWMMRFVDVLYALPYIFIVIILSTLFERGNIFVLFFAIGAVGWLTMARIVRGQVIALRGQLFVEAAVSVGVGHGRLIFRHLIPNALGPIIVYTTLTIPEVMLTEAFLSFLGLGTQEPLSSWGQLVANGSESLDLYPWLTIFPGTALALTLFCFNFLGDGLRDAIDPQTR